MNKEIKLTKREPTWNYILNDLALYSLMTKVIHSEDATYQEKFDLMYQIELLQKQNTELKEENFKLQARIDRFINYWNKLKEWLEDEYKRCDEMGNPAVGYAMGQINRTKNKMQEIEGGMNE